MGINLNDWLGGHPWVWWLGAAMLCVGAGIFRGSFAKSSRVAAADSRFGRTPNWLIGVAAAFVAALVALALPHLVWGQAVAALLAAVVLLLLRPSAGPAAGATSPAAGSASPIGQERAATDPASPTGPARPAGPGSSERP